MYASIFPILSRFSSEKRTLVVIGGLYSEPEFTSVEVHRLSEVGGTSFSCIPISSIGPGVREAPSYNNAALTIGGRPQVCGGGDYWAGSTNRCQGRVK